MANVNDELIVSVNADISKLEKSLNKMDKKMDELEDKEGQRHRDTMKRYEEDEAKLEKLNDKRTKLIENNTKLADNAEAKGKKRNDKRKKGWAEWVNKLKESDNKTARRLGTMAKFIPAGMAIAKTVKLITSAMKNLFLEAVNIEKSMAKLSTIAGQGNMVKITKDIKLMSSELGILASELGEIGYQAISAGVDVEDLAEVLRASVMLSRAGFTSTEKSIDVLTTLMNTYGYSIGTVSDMSDKLLVIQDNGKVTVDQLADSLGQAIPISQSLGISFDELGGSLAYMTGQGIEINSASTALKNLFTELDSDSTKGAKSFEAATGMMYKEWTYLGNSFEEGMRKVSEYSKETGKSVSDMFGKETSVKAINALINGTEELAEKIEAMGDYAGNTEEKVAQLDDTVGRKWDSFATSTANVFLPITDGAKEATKAVLDFFTLSDETAFKNAYRKSAEGASKKIENKGMFDGSRGKYINEMYAKKIHIDAQADESFDAEEMRFYREELLRVIDAEEAFMNVMDRRDEREQLKEDAQVKEEYVKRDLTENNAKELEFTAKTNFVKEEELRRHYEVMRGLEDTEFDTDEQRRLWVEEEEKNHYDRMNEIKVDALQEELAIFEREKLLQEKKIEDAREKGEITVAMQRKLLSSKKKINEKELEIALAQVNELKEVDVKEIYNLEESSEIKNGIRESGKDVSIDVMKQLLTGQISGLKELTKVLTQEVGLVAASEGARLTVKGFAHMVEGKALSAVPGFRAKGIELVAGGKTELAAGAKLGAVGFALSAISGAMGDSDSEDATVDVDEVDDARDEEADDINDIDLDDNCQDLVINVEGSDAATMALLKDMDKLARQKSGSGIFNSQITIKK